MDDVVKELAKMIAKADVYAAEKSLKSVLPGERVLGTLSAHGKAVFAAEHAAQELLDAHLRSINAWLDENGMIEIPPGTPDAWKQQCISLKARRDLLKAAMTFLLNAAVPFENHVRMTTIRQGFTIVDYSENWKQRELVDEMGQIAQTENLPPQ